jgi:beta-glucosidase
MKYAFRNIAGVLLLPTSILTVNSASTNSSTEGILASGTVELGAWTDAYAKATALVSQLTNQEKITIITGGSVDSVNWTALEFKDGTESVQGT